MEPLLGQVQDLRFAERGVTLRYDNWTLRISILQEGMVRIRLAEQGDFAAGRPWAAARPDESFSKVPFDIMEALDGIDLLTETLAIHVGKSGRLTIAHRDGRPILEDGVFGGPYRSDDGWLGWQTSVKPESHFYGFGDRTGLLDKGGRRYTCWSTDPYLRQGPGTDEMYKAVPFLLSVNKRSQ